MKYEIDGNGFYEYVQSIKKYDKSIILDQLADAMKKGAKPTSKWIKQIKPKTKKKRTIGEYSVKFESFWTMYPKHKRTAKGAAWKSWQKYSDEDALYDHCINALKWQTQSNDWNKEGGKYIPMPSTYLNQERFMDEPTKITNKVY